jgi:hypothetical protein
MIAGYQFGDRIINLLIPLYQWEVSHLDNRFQTIFLGVIKQHGELFLQQDIILSKPFFIGTEYFEPNSPVYDSASLPLDYVLQPIVLFLTVILAWPTSAMAQYIYRMILGTPLIFLVLLLDSPLQFNHMICNGIQQNINPGSVALDTFAFWSDFLNGGGLIALSLACGAIAVSLADYAINYMTVRHSQ